MQKNTILLFTALLTGQSIQAANLTIPNHFSANTPAVAAEVNANFAAVETAVDDNDARLAVLESLVAQLQSDLTNANNTISLLQADITALQSNTVLSLDGYLGLVTFDGNDTAEFSGLNVQINNGLNTTSVTNGLGNLIIGYNETSSLSPFFCSNLAYANETDCVNNGGLWQNNVHTGSHNLVVGRGHSFTRYGGLVTGNRNAIVGTYSNVTGGTGNLASGPNSSVSGGDRNWASGIDASISGGVRNIASAQNSSVSGGDSNEASSTDASILGGENNTANNLNATVCGGQGNIASGIHSSVLGGSGNTATIRGASVCGGQDNTASGVFSTVSGGFNRSATGTYNWAAGSLNESN